MKDGSPSDIRPEGLSVTDFLLAILGAAVGGAIGYAAFLLLLRFGIYAMVLPGAMLGIGCSGMSGGASRLLGIACGVAAFALGVFAEWQLAPFRADDSLLFFVTHLHQVRVIGLLMIGLGAGAAFWFGTGRPGGAWPRVRR